MGVVVEADLNVIFFSSKALKDLRRSPSDDFLVLPLVERDCQMH